MKLLILILILLLILFCEELYRYIFRRKSSPLFEILFDSKGHEEAYYVSRAAAEQKMHSRPCEELTMQSVRGEMLKGFYYDNGAAGKTVAFIVHGYRSEHNWTAGICFDYWASRGVDVFACDHTAHGASGGQYIGFDVLECEDCLAWLDVLTEKCGRDVEIILHGFSMGAATVLQMSGRCPDNVKFIVEDSGFRSARASLAHQIGPMYQPMRLINRLLAGYDLDASDVTASLDRAKMPILFVHGREDKLVPFENGPELYERCRGEKDCFFPENTRHIEAMYTQPEQYAQKLDTFAEKYLHCKSRA